MSTLVHIILLSISTRFAPPRDTSPIAVIYLTVRAGSWDLKRLNGTGFPQLRERNLFLLPEACNQPAARLPDSHLLLTSSLRHPTHHHPRRIPLRSAGTAGPFDSVFSLHPSSSSSSPSTSRLTLVASSTIATTHVLPSFCSNHVCQQHNRQQEQHS